MCLIKLLMNKYSIVFHYGLFSKVSSLNFKDKNVL